MIVDNGGSEGGGGGSAGTLDMSTSLDDGAAGSFAAKCELLRLDGSWTSNLVWEEPSRAEEVTLSFFVTDRETEMLFFFDAHGDSVEPRATSLI